jgi:hypothetical protein
MRKSSRLSAPVVVITLYYGAAIGLFYFASYWFPSVAPYMPVGGIEALHRFPQDLGPQPGAGHGLGNRAHGAHFLGVLHHHP